MCEKMSVMGVRITPPLPAEELYRRYLDQQDRKTRKPMDFLQEHVR